MSHHRIAVAVICAAVVIDAALGLAFAKAENLPVPHGLFCGLANAVTDGCDIAPRTHTGYVITALEYALVVPLFAATFSLFTSGLASMHIGRAEARIKQHVNEQMQGLAGPAACGDPTQPDEPPDPGPSGEPSTAAAPDPVRGA